MFINLSKPPKEWKKWFEQYGTKDTDGAVEQLSKWLEEHSSLRPESDKYQRLLEQIILHLVTDYSLKTCHYYITGNWEHVSSEKVLHLDYLLETWDLQLPKPWCGQVDKDGNEKRGKKKDITTGRMQIALLCDLDIKHIPSPRYHLYVISQFVQIGRNYGVALHNVSQAKLEAEIGRIAAIFQPHAIVLLRLTPSIEVEKLLRKFNLPTILVHADKRKTYEYPILANIVPAHNKEEIEADIRKWASRLKSMRYKSNKIVFASMKKEKGEGSVRNERIEAVLMSLRELSGFQVVSCEVDNYSFLEAETIWRRHKDAIAFVVLSDQLAIALKFLVRGRSYGAEIIGYDNSHWAQKAGISSFDQSLDKTGQVVLKILKFFQRESTQFEERTKVLTLQKQSVEKTVVVELPMRPNAKAGLVELPVKLVLR